MPTVANYRIIRVERVELHRHNLGPVKVADFDLPPEAGRHSAVLSLMISPAFSMSVGADFNFALVLNARDVFDDTVIQPPVPGITVIHRPRRDRPGPPASVSVVLPIVDPPWLTAGANTLELRETHDPNVPVGDIAGVGVSDVVLWYQQLVG